MKIELKQMNPGPEANSKELAKIVLVRFGLLPRKIDAKASFHKLLLELYERKKVSIKDKDPLKAVMSVEEMGSYASIKRQTMYDYLGRWLTLNVLKKTSFAKNGTVVRGYELNGSTIEAAFRKAEEIVHSHVDKSIDIIKNLQNEIKKEKLRTKQSVQQD